MRGRFMKIEKRRRRKLSQDNLIIIFSDCHLVFEYDDYNKNEMAFLNFYKNGKKITSLKKEEISKVFNTVKINEIEDCLTNKKAADIMAKIILYTGDL